jgi:hypothetical protein
VMMRIRMPPLSVTSLGVDSCDNTIILRCYCFSFTVTDCNVA